MLNVFDLEPMAVAKLGGGQIKDCYVTSCSEPAAIDDSVYEMLLPALVWGHIQRHHPSVLPAAKTPG